MACKDPVPEPNNHHPFSSVKVCFIPRAFPTNTYANLSLVGTLCYYGDTEFQRIQKLECDMHYPAGTFVPLNENGNIDSAYTISDIGQLNLAFNDYLNFLMDLRKIYEGKGTRADKISAVELLAQGTGRQGHAHSFFVGKHGGIDQLFDKCACRKRPPKPRNRYPKG